MRKTLFSSIILAVLPVMLLLPGAALAKIPLAVIGKNKIKLEVAQTVAQIEHGLMERASMPEDQGMVFLFRPPRPVRFWMYNCLMSLDMLFIKDGKIIKISHDVPPYKLPDPSKAPQYPTEGQIFASEVLEVNAGYCARHGIKDGDSVQFDMPGIARTSSTPAREKEPAGAATGAGKQ
jgi:uncharacterized protein